mmetsp:Transcript_38652/g.83285  ORF Transcript_38652/g.83285 Transcript_38652/m.83285 type:complete len:348 (-) Transcript_38652:822-1865(-)
MGIISGSGDVTLTTEGSAVAVTSTEAEWADVSSSVVAEMGSSGVDFFFSTTSRVVSSTDDRSSDGFSASEVEAGVSSFASATASSRFSPSSAAAAASGSLAHFALEAAVLVTSNDFDFLLKMPAGSAFKKDDVRDFDFVILSSSRSLRSISISISVSSVSVSGSGDAPLSSDGVAGEASSFSTLTTNVIFSFVFLLPPNLEENQDPTSLENSPNIKVLFPLFSLPDLFSFFFFSFFFLNPLLPSSSPSLVVSSLASSVLVSAFFFLDPLFLSSSASLVVSSLVSSILVCGTLSASNFANSSASTLITRIYFPHADSGKVFRFFLSAINTNLLFSPSSFSTTIAYAHL